MLACWPVGKTPKHTAVKRRHGPAQKCIDTGFCTCSCSLEVDSPLRWLAQLQPGSVSRHSHQHAWSACSFRSAARLAGFILVTHTNREGKDELIATAVSQGTVGIAVTCVNGDVKDTVKQGGSTAGRSTGPSVHKRTKECADC